MSVQTNKEARKLAVDGGDPVRAAPFSPWPFYPDEEVESVAAVLRSGRVNYWTGEMGRLFEQEFAKYCRTRHAVAVANGTVAMELAFHVLDIGAGDEVVVTPRTFIASASAFAIRGAKPVFADVDPFSQNITAETIEKVLSRRTKAIVAVHLAGWPCDMDPILSLARERGIRVVEDCAQAHGATYKGRPVGSLGDVAAFSFCQDKIISTGGEGGMLVTDDHALWEQAWAYKDHGKNYDVVYRGKHPPGYRWLHDSFGTNWRMTEMQAAIGRIQLHKLDQWVARRRRNAEILTACFKTIPALRVPRPPGGIGHSYYKYYAFVRPERLCKGWNRDRVLSAILAEGIPCFTGSCPEIYLEKAFEKNGWRPACRLENAKKLGETALMFLVHPTLSEQEMEDTCRAVRKVMDFASS